MRIVFISDVHLNPAQQDNVAFFLRFLKKILCPNDQLYILGDLFEFYIDDDNHNVFTQQIKKALRALNIPIFIMHGNRDFLITKKCAKEMGATLLPDEYVLNLFGHNTLLMHGDTLCTQDKQYLRFRKIVRNSFVQFCFRLLPFRYKKQLAERARLESQRHTSMAAPIIMDVSQDAVLAVMKKHGVHRLIHGHTHKPNVHDFKHNGKYYQRVVLGDWHLGAQVLICSDSRRFKLTSIP